MKQFPGFKAGCWAGDRNTGSVTAFVLFESEEGIGAAEAGLEQMRPLTVKPQRSGRSEPAEETSPCPSVARRDRTDLRDPLFL